MKIENQLSYLGIGEAKYTDASEYFVRFTMKHQLLDAGTWKTFVQLYRSDVDDHDNGWRGEFWGKMMRGACLTYQYTGDEKLYTVLENAVVDLLSTQRKDGRFSTYSKSRELHGWDLWARKYVLTGMMHFYRICRSEELREQILKALCRHADQVLKVVGDEPGKTQITDASEYLGGLNAATILEPMVDLYRLTGMKRYLDFAKYLLRIGGCKDGNLISIASIGVKKPYEYPVTKAYEQISFFEGALAYYEVTGEKFYLRTVQKYADDLNDTDVCIIGALGCNHEFFNHSAETQTVYSARPMLETCVTVTWMRLLARLHLLTGDVRYADRMEQSILNGLYGAVNTEMLPQYSREDDKTVYGLAFDSYSPLYNNHRNIWIGGYKSFESGKYYGCCACISAAGIALSPLCSALKKADGFVFNFLRGGKIQTTTPTGKKITFSTDSDYPSALRAKITLQLTAPEAFSVSIRVMKDAKNVSVSVNGESVETPEAGYLTLTRTWKNGDTVTVTGDYALEIRHVADRMAFTYGPLVLARDSEKEEGSVDLEEAIHPEMKDGAPVYQTVEPEGIEEARLLVKRADGKPDLLLTDYASCGKHWDSEKRDFTVWMN